MKNNYVEFLDFDSEFFKINIAKLKKNYLKKNQISFINNFCKKNKVNLLQFKCDSNNAESIDNAEKLRFKFVDTRIILRKEVQKKYFIEKNKTRIRKASKIDISKLSSFANNMFMETRYYYDKSFPKKKLNSFYNDWIKKGVLSIFDDYVYLLTEKNEILGICTIKENDNNATIGLFGISKDYRNKKYGSIFLKKICNKLCESKIKNINVITQGRNYSALKLYQNHNFLVNNI